MPPGMLAFALRADGWYLRADIIWARPNPMPESVTDRPTKSHSYMFLLAQAAPVFLRPGSRQRDAIGYHDWNEDRVRPASGNEPGWTRLRCQRRVTGQKGHALHGHGKPCGPQRPLGLDHPHPAVPGSPLRHLPRTLARRCILAGTRSAAAAPNAEHPGNAKSKTELAKPRSTMQELDGCTPAKERRSSERSAGENYLQRMHRQRPRVGWRHPPRLPDPGQNRSNGQAGCIRCRHLDTDDLRQHGQLTPCVVLDPFVGSGTVPYVARLHGRHAIGIDLSESLLAARG